MNNCERNRELINQQLDSELNQFEQRLLDNHLTECDSCKTYSSNMIGIHNQLLSLSAIDNQFSIVDKIIADLDHTDVLESAVNIKGINNKRFKKYGLLVAAAAMLLFIPITITLNQNIDFADTKNVSFSSMGVQEESVINNYADEEDSVFTAKEINDSDVIVDGNSDFGAPSALGVANATAYLIEIENNQLMIYQNDEVIYRSNIWVGNLNVDFHQVDENEIIYSLYSQDNEFVGSYKINLQEKTEEKIE